MIILAQKSILINNNVPINRVFLASLLRCLHANTGKNYANIYAHTNANSSANSNANNTTNSNAAAKTVFITKLGVSCHPK